MAGSKAYNGDPAKVDFTAAGGGSGITQEISFSTSDSKNYTNTTSIETKAGAGAGGVTAGVVAGSVGDTVDLGQPIAEAGGFVSAPVHATVSGKVKAIEPRLHPNGSKVLSIVIENDGEDRKHESVHPYDFASMSNEERIECIRSAGIVGHGGATFPTHVKIQSGIGKCDTVIINAAECEPYITSDHRLLLERPEETIGGLKMLADIMGVQTAIIFAYIGGDFFVYRRHYCWPVPFRNGRLRDRCYCGRTG